ncbi:MAG: hypothetical protein H7329_13220 [Opitutaceae bacterium]|nr:hypothetical protein [Cytophagales bacterium]
MRLNYIKVLVIDTIWLSSIFPSTMADFRYDVADRGIHPMFGTMDECD